MCIGGVCIELHEEQPTPIKICVILCVYITARNCRRLQYWCMSYAAAHARTDKYELEKDGIAAELRHRERAGRAKGFGRQREEEIRVLGAGGDGAATHKEGEHLCSHHIDLHRYLRGLYGRTTLCLY